jgi:hypothetical protein
MNKEPALRCSRFALALLFALAGTMPASAQSAVASCEFSTKPTMPPNAGPYMQDMPMNAPMVSQMKKEGMVLGDVAEMAKQQAECMDKIMKSEERMMDQRQK